ncbi:Regulating synaptic membrane exocytosis protein 1 [Nymphon striatum]|nr:Regulating synaptic membrane exocytosis protein 1 [Nymphon striatum]
MFSDQECNRMRSGVILSHRDYQLDPRKPDMYHDGRPSVTITSPGSPGTVRSKPHSIKGSPRVQLKLWYDSQKQTFYVTVICATDIPLKGPSRKTRNLYVKLYLLPDRGEFKYFSAESKRRTKPIANTNEPKWNVKFIYDCVRWSDLKLNSLEVTLWDYNPKCASDFLGEYVIDINSAPLDNQPEWYSLHDETSQLRSRHNMYIDSEIASSITSADRLSPPSTISRLSDSDASEYDEEFMRVDRKLIGGDGASISSIGSSCSPPLVSEDSSEMVIDTHRLSRRDISLSSIHSTRRRPNIVLSKDDYQYHRGVLGQQNNPNVITDSARLRSRSAAQSPIYDSHSGRSRSKSPNRRGLSDSRSLSPPGASIIHKYQCNGSLENLPQKSRRKALNALLTIECTHGERATEPTAQSVCVSFMDGKSIKKLEKNIYTLEEPAQSHYLNIFENICLNENLKTPKSLSCTGQLFDVIPKRLEPLTCIENWTDEWALPQYKKCRGKISLFPLLFLTLKRKGYFPFCETSFFKEVLRYFSDKYRDRYVRPRKSERILKPMNYEDISWTNHKCLSCIDNSEMA